MANRLATSSHGREEVAWPSVGDDDPVTIAADLRKDTVRASAVREGCALLLVDLRQHELWPEPMANPDVDRWKIPLTLKDTP